MSARGSLPFSLVSRSAWLQWASVFLASNSSCWQSSSSSDRRKLSWNHSCRRYFVSASCCWTICLHSCRKRTTFASASASDWFMTFQSLLPSCAAGFEGSLLKCSLLFVRWTGAGIDCEVFCFWDSWPDVTALEDLSASSRFLCAWEFSFYVNSS